MTSSYTVFESVDQHCLICSSAAHCSMCFHFLQKKNWFDFFWHLYCTCSSSVSLWCIYVEVLINIKLHNFMIHRLHGKSFSFIFGICPTSTPHAKLHWWGEKDIRLAWPCWSVSNLVFDLLTVCLYYLSLKLTHWFPSCYPLSFLPKMYFWPFQPGYEPD